MRYITANGTEREGGVEILRWRIEVPFYEGLSEISSFYEGLLENACEFCKGGMTEKARDAYRSCEDPRKKFRFPPMVYRLIAKERARQGDLLSVETEISLLAGTDILFRERMGQIFCESEQILLSPQDALAQWGGGRSPHRIPRGEIGGILLWENKMWKRQNGEWILFAENKKGKNQQKSKKILGISCKK